MIADPPAATANPDFDARLEEEVDRLLVSRFRAESGLAELVHVLLALVAGFLLWQSGFPGTGMAWTAAVSLAVVVRTWLRRRALGITDLRESQLYLRSGVLLVAAAWGFGALIAAPNLLVADLALLLVLFSGLIAGASVSLLADPTAFQLLLGLLLIPLAVGFLRSGETHRHLVGVLLMALYAGGMLIFYRRSHRALREQFRTAKRLQFTEEEARGERTMLDALVAGTPGAIAVVERSGRLVRINDNFERLFGFSAAEAVGSHINDLLIAETARPEALDLQNRVWAGETIVTETERRRKNGETVAVRMAAAPIRLGDRMVAFVIYDDISQAVAAREALKAARDSAEEATAAKSAFLANMSHEIRTPMNGILGMVELLLDTDLSPEQRRSAELIGLSGHSLMQIINDILDFSKIEAGHLEIETTEFDLHPVVESAVRLLMSRAHERALELVCDIRPDVPHRVAGDSNRIRQVLSNLLNNAIKFTHAGEIEVSVRTVRQENGSSRVRFSVRDTGIGISPATQAAIFEPFKQADVSTSRKYGGTGLGLSISRRLVELMAGRLEVESTLGTGSTFSFELDLPVVSHASHEGIHRVGLQDVKVLIVDDHPVNRRVVHEMLVWGGCIVNEATGTDEAMSFLRDAAQTGSPYQLVLSDVHMPGRDGFELAEEIRRDPAIVRTHIMLLTSGGRKGDGQRCRELGIGAYLLKPVSRVELLEATVATLSGGNARPSGMHLVTRHSSREGRRNLRILVAEDNPVNQEVARSLLQKRGHVVDVVDNGVQAVTAVQRAPYDLVLMDIQMPEMDGIRATQAIRRFLGDRPLPIIAVTANAMSGERERCLAAGMDEYLSKPFKPHDLFAIVEGWGQREPAGESGGPVATPVDVEGLRAEMRTAGVEEIIPDLLRTFVHDASSRMTALRNAAAAGDAPGLERAAHAYKSAAGTVRAMALAALLKDTEGKAKVGDIVAAAALVPRIEEAHDAAMRYLAALAGPPEIRS